MVINLDTPENEAWSIISFILFSFLKNIKFEKQLIN